MFVMDIQEMSLISVMDRGIPNKECIAIQVNQSLNTGQYGVMLGRYAGGNSAVPIQSDFFWFGDCIVNAGDWIFIYTGSGQATVNKSLNNVNDNYTTYWGKPSTVFVESEIVPMLFRVDAVSVLPPPENVPQ